MFTQWISEFGELLIRCFEQSLERGPCQFVSSQRVSPTHALSSMEIAGGMNQPAQNIAQINQPRRHDVLHLTFPFNISVGLKQNGMPGRYSILDHRPLGGRLRVDDASLVFQRVMRYDARCRCQGLADQEERCPPLLSIGGSVDSRPVLGHDLSFEVQRHGQCPTGWPLSDKPAVL